MSKTWLIIKREYLTRVKKRTFILSTILTPLLFAGVITVVILMTVKNVQEEKIAVRDSSGFFKGKLESTNQLKFEFPGDVDTSNFDERGYSGVLYTPYTDNNQKDSFLVFTRKNLSLMASSNVDNQITKAIENHLLDSLYKINLSTLDSVRKQARSAKIGNSILRKGEQQVKQGNSGVAYGVGYGAAFLIYITLFIYGAMVMRGVMEEKVNRIAEVMVSSVKPFQLMIGKIIGIGAVGLTQFFMWIILVTVFTAIINSFIPPEVLQQVQNNSPQMGNTPQASQAIMSLARAKTDLATVNWWLLVGCFIFYFLFGYLFYAALFAAVGSAVNEDPQDAQSLMFPVTMPIILGIIIMINAITNPTSPMAIWSSIIPFFSSIVMMARLPFGVPGTVAWWELGLSMLLLVAGFLFTTWLSAKIYRTGILLYGKKATWKEMWKWAFRKS